MFSVELVSFGDCLHNTISRPIWSKQVDSFTTAQAVAWIVWGMFAAIPMPQCPTSSLYGVLIQNGYLVVDSHERV